MIVDLHITQQMVGKPYHAIPHHTLCHNLICITFLTHIVLSAWQVGGECVPVLHGLHGMDIPDAGGGELGTNLQHKAG
jgi:hypothetical protein